MTMYVDPISGPIVACDNAIAHYEKEIQKVIDDISYHRRKLENAIDQQSTLTSVLDQWATAKTVLVDARRQRGLRVPLKARQADG